MKTIENLPLPRTNTQEVLMTLLQKGNVSIFDYPYMSGFRTRVSDLILKYGLELEKIKNKRCNKFGNTYMYVIHKLSIENKQKAIEIYRKISSN